MFMTLEKVDSSMKRQEYKQLCPTAQSNTNSCVQLLAADLATYHPSALEKKNLDQ